MTDNVRQVRAPQRMSRRWDDFVFYAEMVALWAVLILIAAACGVGAGKGCR